MYILNIFPGVLRQGINGDFVSFLPWLNWDGGDQWFGLGKCLFLYADPVAGKPNRSAMWNDSDCSTRHKYVCERTIPPDV